MLDRIERVSRVKGVESAIDRGFERKEGYNDSKKNKQSFLLLLVATLVLQ